MVVFFLSMEAGGAAGVQRKGNAGGRSRRARQPAESIGYGVFAARVQRVATQEPAQGQPEASEQAVPPERFDRVMRAGWMKTAAGARAEKQRQQRTDPELV